MFEDLFPDWKLFGLFRYGVRRVETQKGIYRLENEPTAKLDDFGERGGYHPRIRVEYHLETPGISKF
jgi:hypothetical protein